MLCPETAGPNTGISLDEGDVDIGKHLAVQGTRWFLYHGPPGEEEDGPSAGKAVDGNPSQDDVGLIIGVKKASTLAAITAVRMADTSPAHALPKG